MRNFVDAVRVAKVRAYLLSAGVFTVVVFFIFSTKKYHIRGARDLLSYLMGGYHH